MDDLLVIGSAGHAKVVIDTILCSGKYNIIGLIDDYREKNKEYTLEYPVIGGMKDIDTITKKYNLKNCFIAVGDNYSRYILHKKIRHHNFNFPTIIHPSVIVSKYTRISQGTIISAGAVLNCNANIGAFCIINTNSTIEHDVILGDFSSTGPGAVLAGNVAVGSFTVIAMNAAVIEKTTLGNNVLVGAYSLVNSDIGDNSVVYGVPAKFKRKREKGEKYLR